MAVTDYRIYISGSPSGTIQADCDTDRVKVTSRIDSNGRGAKLDEMITFNDKQLPVDWRVTGTSLMGAEVAEEYRSADGDHTWRSQAEATSVQTTEPKLYLAADTSRFSLWFYLRAALNAGGSIPTLPTGTLRARTLREVHLDNGHTRLRARAFALTGMSLVPEYAVIDSDGQLIAAFAQFGLSELIVREDFTEHADTLTQLFDDLVMDHLVGIQERTARHFDQPVRVTNVHLLDPARRSLSGPVSVTFFRGDITSVAAQDTAATPGEIVMDGGGGTLIPGLHDMHAHIDAFSALFYVAAGVTSVRDMGNENHKLLTLVEQTAAQRLAGPTITRSGFIEGESPYSARHGIIPQTLDEALDAVRWYAARGYHQIKIYNSMNPDWVRPMAQLAHQLGMRAVGHVPAFATPDQMIDAGYDEITHVNQLMLGWIIDPREDTRTPLRMTAMARARDLDLSSQQVRHTIGLMRDKNIGLDTTAVTLEALMLSRARTTLPADAPVIENLPVSYQRQRRRTFVPHTTDTELEAYDQSFETLLQLLGILHEEGVELWPGTDDGTGFSLHRELELYVDAGLHPSDVMDIATRRCAEHLGMGHSHGTIERGKTASFALLDGDPTRDISAVRRVRAVVNNGVLYMPNDIYNELGIAPFTTPPTIHGHGAPAADGGAV